ncbi:multiple antibiotic resistance protein MarA [Oxobacter pfennigii]|uniref:Multiple antibiotic resistance protein MarA n=1 Tax=Oxobacter pfennigii TaxID=36849 RepID=A0A0P8W5Z6_9CLOT|nr:AraC family transcriptional regulator [Oxobacter pfennigii]KPU43117.1 multiple antibiotic resistance protein MarA [Oxobacter pfennigii]
MQASEKEKNFYGPNIKIIKKKEGCTVYRMMTPGGEGVMTSHMVFPGIELVYNDFHTSSCFHNIYPKGEIMEINHCRAGRFECEFRGGSYGYLGEGDLSVNMLSNHVINSSFPLDHYHGVAVIIDFTEASQGLLSFLDDISINLYLLRDRLCPDNRCFIMRAKEEIQHIFSELYTVPEEIRKGYFKLKILELLLFLSVADIPRQSEPDKYFTKNQVETVKEIKKYITNNMDKRITLTELSSKFGIGLTTMKLCFKRVYGTSISAYIKYYRMQAAALLLRQSNDSVMHIAAKAGYENSSKFAAAFKEIMGIPPLKFRKNLSLFNGGKET